ncbi:hypothetical protein DFP72DRAFT_82799 [Ephemerocybe angulata]|uniref:Uncharacterized protein n=1 Tax=Ephemerocybe angulata TaxID=980116 RepID=A0A8H6HDU7_9AGAR|nr:hypothetical protein DFP72DRAFT_82799 [Tulosesus angulatus]
MPVSESQICVYIHSVLNLASTLMCAAPARAHTVVVIDARVFLSPITCPSSLSIRSHTIHPPNTFICFNLSFVKQQHASQEVETTTTASS